MAGTGPSFASLPGLSSWHRTPWRARSSWSGLQRASYRCSLGTGCCLWWFGGAGTWAVLGSLGLGVMAILGELVMGFAAVLHAAVTGIINFVKKFLPRRLAMTLGLRESLGKAVKPYERVWAIKEGANQFISLMPPGIMGVEAWTKIHNEVDA